MPGAREQDRHHGGERSLPLGLHGLPADFSGERLSKDALAGQTEIACEVVGNPKELDRHRASGVSPRVAGQARLPRETAVRPLRTRKDHLCGAEMSLKRWGQKRQIHLDPLVEHSRQTGAPIFAATPIAFWSRRLACGARSAKGKGDNGEYAHQTRCAGSHRFLCVAHAGSIFGLPGTEAFHQAGAHSPGPRSDRPSMRNPLLEEQSQRKKWCVVEVAGEQEQTRSCAVALA